MKGFPSYQNAQSIESRVVIGPEKYTVCRLACTFFSPEILQAVAVKGLMKSTEC